MENSPQYFLSALTHEIRNSMNGIVGYCQLLSQTRLDSVQQQYLNSMNVCSLQLIELLNDILDYSRLSLGKAELSMSCTSFTEILEEVTSIMATKINDKNQKFRYIIDSNLPKFIVTDKKKVVQILVNLVSNANKFTDVGGRIIVNVENKPDNQVEFSVEDNGIGISEKDQKKLFNAFTQVQDSVTKQGSGLGLAICKKLVELLKGSISVDSESRDISAFGETRSVSEKSSGSVFTFTISYEPFEEYEHTIVKNIEIMKGKIMLVVSSDVDTRMQLSDLLFDFGVRPVLCASSKEAVKMLSAKRYDFTIVIMDVYISDSGIELAKRIKEINSEIAIIGMNDKSEIVRDITKFDQVVEKPVNKVKLMDTLFHVIKKTDISQFELNPVEQAVKTEKSKTTDSVNSSPLTPKQSEKRIKILIAEDMSHNMDMLVKMLATMGYTDIDTVSDGSQAVEKLQKNPYDILLLDLKMPKLDGFGVAEYLFSRNGKDNVPKIAVITASVLDDDRERCKKLGIKYFILKPFNMTHLKSIMTRLVYGTVRANSLDMKLN